MSSTNKPFNAKEYLIEFFRFCIYKLETDSCTMSEIEKAARAIQETMDLDATADDLSNHFGKSRDSVYAVVKRNIIKKPKRNVVLHSFQEFLKAMPTSWRKSN